MWSVDCVLGLSGVFNVLGRGTITSSKSVKEIWPLSGIQQSKKDSFTWLLFFNYHPVSRSLAVSGHVLNMSL